VIQQTSDKKLDVDEKPRHGNPDNSEVYDGTVEVSLRER